jgi:hypothetical protein
VTSASAAPARRSVVGWTSARRSAAPLLTAGLLTAGLLTCAGVVVAPTVGAVDVDAVTEQTCGDRPPEKELAEPPALTWLAADQA